MFPTFTGFGIKKPYSNYMTKVREINVIYINEVSIHMCISLKECLSVVMYNC